MWTLKIIHMFVIYFEWYVFHNLYYEVSDIVKDIFLSALHNSKMGQHPRNKYYKFCKTSI